MSLAEAAESTRKLAAFLCESVEEVWENHTDESIKSKFSLEEISEYLKANPADTN